MEDAGEPDVAFWHIWATKLLEDTAAVLWRKKSPSRAVIKELYVEQPKVHLLDKMCSGLSDQNMQTENRKARAEIQEDHINHTNSELLCLIAAGLYALYK